MGLNPAGLHNAVTQQFGTCFRLSPGGDGKDVLEPINPQAMSASEL